MQYADRDANDLANAIFNTQASLYTVVPHLLVDKDANKLGIMRVLALMRSDMEKGGGNDLAVVHFSGHGAMVDGKLYLLPQEVRVRHHYRDRSYDGDIAVIVLALDPGLSGGIAILDEQTIHLLADMPVHKVTRGKAARPELDMHGLCALLAHHPLDHAVIEQVSARPGQGVTSMFRFGYAAGALYGAVAALGLPISFVPPKAWQRFCGIGPHPDDARRRASQLYPAAAARLSRKVDANKADALLIGRYGLHLLRTSALETPAAAA